MDCKVVVACYKNKTNNCNKELDPSDEGGWVQDHEGAKDFLGIFFSDSEEN
jgi:hypothetical protein